MEGKKQAVRPGDFVFSVTGLEHGHIEGMCGALIKAGAQLKAVYEPDESKRAAFLRKFPQAVSVSSEEALLQDPGVHLIASAAIPAQRCALGLRVMAAGKDYFTDKGPFTSLAQLEAARQAVRATGRKYMVYYSERLHNEGAVLAGQMIEQGEIGDVIQVTGFGPHRLGAAGRPPWFYRRADYGGILCDIGSHQIEQYLYYAGEEDGEVTMSRVGNYDHPQYPELEDFGDCAITGKKGTTNYFRVDWFTPDGLGTWGDGRTLILGTKGYIEIRKYIDIASGKPGGNHVFLVNHRGERRWDATGMTGHPFFGQLITDCLNRTEYAMTQRHAFKAAELCLIAQERARRISPEQIAKKERPDG